MRILQLCNKFPYPPKDGGAIAIYNLIKGLGSMGHDVTVLAMNTRKHFTDAGEVINGLKDIAEFSYININTDINIIKAAFNIVFSRIPYNAGRFISKEFAAKIEDILIAEKYDIVQLEGLYLIPYVDIVRQNSDALISYRAHNIEHEIWEGIVRNEKNILRRWYLRIMAKRIRNLEISAMNSYDLLVPITHRDAQILNSLGNNKPYHVCPVGIDDERIQHQKGAINYRSVFFLGSLDWFPNQEGLVWFIDNVWERIHTKYPDVEFYVAGRNAPGWLENKITRTGNIVFKGEIEDAYAFMADKGIMVVPLFSGSGMRVKIIEGMAHDKVIISTAMGAEGIDIRHGENILIAESADEFEKELENILENKSFFTKIGKNAGRFVAENLNNNKITAALAGFYKTNLK
jgi:glycosyltransferase involved in cell wall biosynthesis